MSGKRKDALETKLQSILHDVGINDNNLVLVDHLDVGDMILGHVTYYTEVVYSSHPRFMFFISKRLVPDNAYMACPYKGMSSQLFLVVDCDTNCFTILRDDSLFNVYYVSTRFLKRKYIISRFDDV